MILYYRKKLIDKTCASLNFRRSIPLLLMAMAIWLICSGVSYGYIIINAPMTGTDQTNWVLGGNPTSSLLTGNGTIDPVGSGWLRLTNNSGNQTGYAYNITPFDLSQGLLVQFDYATWGGSGADGYSVYLFDAGVPSPGPGFVIGAFGGSLGYAQKLSTATCNPPATTVPGITGGYVGIGVDEYGNFAYGCEGRYLGNSLQANTVTIRGSVVGFGNGAIGSTQGTTSYPWIATSANNGSLWYNGATRPVQTSANYRKVIIQISPAPNPTANVWIQFGYNTTPVQMINGALLPAISTSQSLMVGYAASTGGSTNYHEIRNLLVTNQGTSTSIDLGITKTASVATATIGSPITYTLTAINYGPNNITATGVGITDNVPTNITGVAWTCAVVAGSPSGTSCGAASGSGNALNTTANLPYGGSVTYTITGTVSAPAPAQLSNTASLVIPGSVTDYNPNNNSATVTVPVNNLSTSTKTVTDLTGSNYAAGDTLQYTITLNENGGLATSGISVADTIDTTNLTGQTITGCPSGATCSYSAGALSATGISIPANGSVTIVYTATIVSTDTPGTAINNTATVTNPNGAVVTLVAPVVTVGGTAAGTGTKLLYLYDGTSTPTWKLSRTKPTGLTGTQTLAKTGGSYTSAENPVLASNVTINASVPVTLYLASDATATRNVEVRLACSSATGTYLSSGNVTETNMSTAVNAYNFTLTAANGTATLPMTCATGNSWQLTVINQSTGNGTRNVIVYPMSGTNNSYVSLPSQNVINVNSISLYSAAYPGGSIVSSVASGTTVYIRAVVSDPFGSYDIVNIPTITIKNPSGTTIVSAAAMTYYPASLTSLTKTYDYAFQVLSSYPAGNWSISVTATEGTEGTVSDTGYASMSVTLPAALTVVKSASPSPVNPGQVLTYTITITNTGAGTATNATAIDHLPAYTTYVANSTRLNGITVAGDGSTLPLIAGLLIDNNSGRAAAVAASGTLPSGGVATIVFQVTVN
ncbi:MAG: hypothetical protein ABSD50_02605 [Smithella sp.]|jgi:uncharacterized repeat protein (TIGR01451 family)